MTEQIDAHHLGRLAATREVVAAPRMTIEQGRKLAQEIHADNAQRERIFNPMYVYREIEMLGPILEMLRDGADLSGDQRELLEEVEEWRQSNLED